MTTTLVIAVIGLLVIADQLSKLWVLNTLVGSPSQMVIPGLLQLTYVENRGIAFGMFQGRVGILSLITLAVLLTLLILLIRGKFRESKLVTWCIALILAGGFGNLIDRIVRGYVVDYLDISPLFSFPVFNFADCCVVIGTFVLLIYLLFSDFGKQSKKTPESSEQDGEEPIG